MKNLLLLLLIVISFSINAQKMAMLHKTDIDNFTVSSADLENRFDAHQFSKDINIRMTLTGGEKGKRKFPLGYGILGTAIGVGAGAALILDANNQDIDGLGAIGTGIQYLAGGAGIIIGLGGISTSLLLGRK